MECEAQCGEYCSSAALDTGASCVPREGTCVGGGGGTDTAAVVYVFGITSHSSLRQPVNNREAAKGLHGVPHPSKE
ncbi:hypothetical protein Y032_0822g2534 [Ancylostoma ceylanicum]|uniref:Uncharacterized protein n=1 Tax=Ancylostoma ceylanicum TaxID=53326 RepID=A0A016WDR9_9BILA|nr:hypothetical protein Y032_0822g2534 [Ancylostoma ceylanicum]